MERVAYLAPGTIGRHLAVRVLQDGPVAYRAGGPASPGGSSTPEHAGQRDVVSIVRLSFGNSAQ